MVKKLPNVSQLTAYERVRLNKNRNCPICGKRIFDFQEIVMRKLRDGHKVYYQFFHNKCVIKSGLLLNGVERYGEE